MAHRSHSSPRPKTTHAQNAAEVGIRTSSPRKSRNPGIELHKLTRIAKAATEKELTACSCRIGPVQCRIPTALIGRLARDERVRGEGIGGLLLADAIRRVIGATRSLAVFAIVVDATDEKAAVFYRDFGFTPFPNRPLRLFMPASAAAEAVSRALSR